MTDEKSDPGVLRPIWRRIIGRPRDISDPGLFQHMSLAVFLAWVGLGADGLSSSAYGPEEAYKALGSHSHLAILLVLMTAATITVISIAYANLIQHFPGGGGGYLVATKLLGSQLGVVSGCALLVDYVLTITVSVASGCDQLWSCLPMSWLPYKLPAEFVVLVLLVILNMRGVKESVRFLAPVFLLFVATHAFMIVYAIVSRATELPGVFYDAGSELHDSVGELGLFPVILILLRAYSLGGGTYTGIETVSNGVSMLREPRVQTGKRTMAIMAFSLAFTAGGILFGYLLTDSTPVAGRTMNAVLLTKLFGSWQLGDVAVGSGFVVVSLIAAAALLFVAAQAGFLAGPRVLANMALDSWMPHRFSQLSDRLVAQNGVLMMAMAAAAALLYTGGNISILVMMYSINVFITFTLTELGMARHFIVMRKREPNWKKLLALHGTGLVMCSCILIVTVYEKIFEGGWITLAITGGVIGLCFWVRAHYREVERNLRQLDQVLVGTPPPPDGDLAPADRGPLQRNAPTAVICVTSYSGYGLHHVLSIHRLFPDYFANFLFVSAAVLDSGTFKGSEEIHRLEAESEVSLRKYVSWARAHGLRADYRRGLGTEAVATMEDICCKVAEEFPRSIVFMGKLIFRKEKWYHRFLHNETALAIQRRLQFAGVPAMVLPIRVEAA